MNRLAACASALCALALSAPVPAQGEEPAEGADAAAVEAVEEEASSSSALDQLSLTAGWQTSVTALSFSESTDLTYDPYVGMRWRVAPAWTPSEHLSLSLSFAWRTELTESNVTTRRREVLVDDLSLRVAAPGFWTIPAVDVGLSAELGLRFPTSKASQRASLVMGVSPGLSLSRSVSVLSGWSFGYGLSVDVTPHRYTTPGLDIDGCGARGANCEVSVDTSLQGIPGAGDDGVGIARVNLGSRNARLAVNHTLSTRIAFIPELSFGLSWTHASYWLYALGSESDVAFDDVVGAPDEAAPARTLAPQDRRWVQVWGLSLGYAPIDALRFTLGATTAGNPRAPNNDLRDPIFNRNTQLYVDVALDVFTLFAGTRS